MISVSLLTNDLLVFSAQVTKVKEVLQAHVGYLAQMENQVQEDLKVLKENLVHLDQELKDVQEIRYCTHFINRPKMNDK